MMVVRDLHTALLPTLVLETWLECAQLSKFPSQVNPLEALSLEILMEDDIINKALDISCGFLASS